MRLQEARLRADLSQKGLGLLAGLDPSVASPRINQYERGVHVPTYTTLAQLGNVLKVPVAYFYCHDDAMATLLLDYHEASDSAKKRISRAFRSEK